MPLSVGKYKNCEFFEQVKVKQVFNYDVSEAPDFATGPRCHSSQTVQKTPERGGKNGRSSQNGAEYPKNRAVGVVFHIFATSNEQIA